MGRVRREEERTFDDTSTRVRVRWKERKQGGVGSFFPIGVGVHRSYYYEYTEERKFWLGSRAPIVCTLNPPLSSSRLQLKHQLMLSQLAFGRRSSSSPIYSFQFHSLDFLHSSLFIKKKLLLQIYLLWEKPRGFLFSSTRWWARRPRFKASLF